MSIINSSSSLYSPGGEILKQAPSRATIQIIATRKGEAFSSLNTEGGAFGLASFAALETTGIGIAVSRASLLSGLPLSAPALAEMEDGTPSNGESYQALETYGEGKPALSLATINTVTSGNVYTALAILAVALDRSGLSLASLTLRGGVESRSFALLEVRRGLLILSQASLEVVLFTRSPAYASLVMGGLLVAIARAGIDISTGEGIQFLIDILDAILASGHGDC